MGGETNCWPFVERIPEFPECKTPYRFLNTGTYIGTVKSILELFCNLNIDDHLHACDQRTVMKFYLDHLTNHKLEDAPFILDTNCELFLPLFDLRDVIRLDISPTRVKCLNTGTFPCIIHANGKSFKHWDTIYDSIVHTNNGFRKAMNINNNVQMVCIDSGKKLSVNDKGEVVFAQDSFGWTLLPTDKPNEYFILDNVFGHALTARGHHNGAQLYLDEQRKTCWQVFPLDTGEVVISSNGFAIDDKGVKNKNEAIPAHLWEANWGNCNQLLRLTPL